MVLDAFSRLFFIDTAQALKRSQLQNHKIHFQPAPIPAFSA
jgi:hypothetical protein